MAEKRYYQEEIETMPLEQLRALQKEKLLKQVRHVYDNVPYYRAKMEEKGVTPEDIQELEDIAKLPFLSKADLRDAYPYGLLAKPLSDCVRIQSTSGTTGKRVVAFYTQKDIDLWEDCCARAIVAVGGTKEDAVVFEDALHPIRTARAAGFRVAAIYDSSSDGEHEEIKALSDYYFYNYDELTVEL